MPGGCASRGCDILAACGTTESLPVDDAGYRCLTSYETTRPPRKLTVARV